jgi:prefoldin beta subunit
MVDLNKNIQEFERSRVQLAAIENQSNTLSMQSKFIDEALKELKETKEEKVYKAVGNILILSDSKKVMKELEEQKETIALRLKTIKKQEEAVIDKMNKLKNEIENAQKSSTGENKEEN